MRLRVNGSDFDIDVDPETPLLVALREHLRLTGTKYGCGAGQCGACTVHVDGEAVFSCVTPLDTVVGTDIVTIEGLSKDGLHPLQRAWIEEQVPQCGYCQSGMIMRAAVLLDETPNPSRDQIIDHMDTNLCRCGTYARVIRAVETAVKGSL